MFTFQGTNWKSKMESTLFMLIGALLTNIPAVMSWLTANTHLDPASLSVIAVILAYFAKAWVMQPTPVLPPNPQA